MKNLSLNKYSKVGFLVFAMLLFLILSLLVAINNKTSVFAMDNNLNSLNLQSENFADDCVVVVLDKKISKINKIHNAKFFSGIKIKSLEDLTKRKINIKSKNNDFKQILKIYLKDNSKENVLSAIKILNEMDGIISAEPNYYFEPAVDPNDPDYLSGQLWGLNDTNGISANLAWNITRGSNRVRVGILDTGIAAHEDLNANLVSGRDTFNNNNITIDDTNSHGTHVAGTVGAVGNNSLGVVGVNWNVSLVPLQAANASNTFSSTDVVEAIEWAEDRWGTSEQIDIINYSVGGFGRTTAVREAVRNYHGLFVWAAGNETTDVDTRISTYGSFNLSNLISVGAINEDETRRNTSNYSANNTNINIYAPGTEIFSTVPIAFSTSGYSNKSGTSMAAPHVTGVAALILSVNPNLTAAEIKEIILESADTITISIPSNMGTSIAQQVKKLNAFSAVSALDFITTDLGTDEIQIDGINREVVGKLTIPAKLNNRLVTHIKDYAFQNQDKCSEVAFPDDIRIIGYAAFKNCTELKVISPISKVQSISGEAFKNCKSLIALSEMESLEIIGAEAFTDCSSLTTITGTSRIRNIGDKAFENCANLTSVSAMDNLEHIGVRAFAACSKLTSLPSLNSLKTIEDEAFQQCRALTRIALPSCLTSVGEGAFANCGEMNISVDSENSNYYAHGNVLYDKNMTTIIAAGKINSDIVIPKSVKEIYPFAFEGNSNLSTVQIQSYITIGNFAFANCSSLHSVYIDVYSNTNLGINAFYNDNFVLFVPYNEQDYYRNKFAGYTQNIDSIKVTVTFVNDGVVVKEFEVYYGSTIKGIVKYSKSGYIFDGWYDNEAFNGSKYINGQMWTSKENITLYVRLISEAAINNYIRQFQTVGTHYIQNAYNSSRSTGLSIVDIPKYYQSTGNIAAGFKLYNDSMAFDRLNSMVVRPLTIIVGYTKTSVFKELETINSWLDKCDNIVIMGNSLFTFLKAMGYETGLAHVEDKYIDFATEIMEKADQKGINLSFPRFVNTISSDGQNSCGLREINNIPANEIPFTTMDYNYPESLLRVGGTLVTYGYPIFYPLDKLPNGGSIQVNNLLEEKCLDFVRYNEGNIPQNTSMFFVKDWLNLKKDDRYLFYTDADDIPTLDDALYQNIMVNGNIHSISDFIYRKEDVIIMRVECNVGKMGEVLSQERFKKNIAAFIPDLKYILDNFECKVILIGCNRVEKDKDWNLYEYSDPNFLNTCSEMLGAQFGFISFDVLDSIHSMRGQFYWTNNIDPYEKYYAF